MKEIIRIKRSTFETRSKFLTLVAIDSNTFIYKKRFKYKIKTFLKVIGMILWIPINIPYSLVVAILFTLAEWWVDMIDSFRGNDIKEWCQDIKSEFKSIQDCIFEIED